MADILPEMWCLWYADQMLRTGMGRAVITA